MSSLINHPSSGSGSESRPLTKMPIVDSHAHFWDIDHLNYPWLEKVPAINKTFLLGDYKDETEGIPIEKIVFVQSDCRPDQGLEEVNFINKLAQEDRRINAIVAYNPIDHLSEAFRQLDQLKKNPLVRGIRSMFDDSDRFICADSIEVLRTLPSYDYSFDVCIHFSELDNIIRMIELCPDTQFVIDHLAKPDIQGHRLAEFKIGMERLSIFPNVYAKLSGLVTEAGPNWSVEQIEPFVTYAIERFGASRLMFGGNWPVVLLNGSFLSWYQTVENIIESYSPEEREQLLFSTASQFYRI